MKGFVIINPIPIKPSILIVDDNEENISALSHALREDGYIVRAAVNGLQALERVKVIPPDLILMDIQMPVMDGYKACEEIKKIDEFKSIPVIFISGMNVFFNKKIAFDLGGVDYIEKPFVIEEVKIRVKTHIELYHYQKQLKESNISLLKLFKCSFEQATVAMMDVDGEFNKILRANHYCSILFGYSHSEIINKRLFDFFHDENKKRQIAFFDDEVFEYLMPRNCECLCVTKDGNKIWIKISITRVQNVGDQADFHHLIMEDITSQKKNEDLIYKKNYELKKIIGEKETLIKELYHRTKNNMQVIASMVKLKAAANKGTETNNVLQEIEAKIYSMSLVHKLLYKSDNLSYINFREYINELVTLCNEIRLNKRKTVHFDCIVDDSIVIIDVALPVGLIFSELICNSIKHGFPESSEGKISIHISIKNEEITCEYEDNGIGFPDDFDFDNNKSIGLLLVKDLMEKQLMGEISCPKKSRGVYFYMKFDTKMYRPRV